MKLMPPTSDERLAQTQQPRRKRTLVIGLGNPLCADDGAGVLAARMLQSKTLPQGVEVQALGTPGWNLVACLEGRQQVYVIDAINMGVAPGAWRRFGQHEVSLLTSEPPRSLHEPALAESLALARVLGLLPPEIVIYGIEPGNIGLGEGISSSLEKSLPALVQHLYNELWKGI